MTLSQYGKLIKIANTEIKRDTDMLALPNLTVSDKNWYTRHLNETECFLEKCERDYASLVSFDPITGAHC